jgi:hypothetical protein
LTQAKGADSTVLALVKGIAQVVAAGYAPTAVALHPDDWTDSQTVLIANGGSSLADILEVPVVKTASVAAGTGYVGAWNQLVVWTRSTDVFVSRTHSDYLTRNLAAVRDPRSHGSPSNALPLRSKHGKVAEIV